MKSPVLTKWQRRQKVLIDEAFLNPDVYQELGYIRRDYYSTLAIINPVQSFDERLLRVMAKYKIPIDCFEVLSKFCSAGGDLDYSLINQLKDSKGKPAKKSKPNYKLHELHWEIYKMSIHQLMTKSEIVDELRKQDKLHGDTRHDDINLVSHVVRRMNVADVNRDSRLVPVSGKKLKKM
jgi:hypothetical protein